MIARRDVPDAITKYERDGGHLRAGGPDRWPDLLLAGQRVGQIAHQLDAPFLRHVPVTVADNSTHIEAPGLNLLRVQPAARARVAFLPQTRGRFRFICSIEGHAEAGMVGLVDVR